jgi:cell division transport system permease protein
MKLSMGRQFVKEGVLNIIRHPLVTLASITTISLMLILMGSFLIFSTNANDIAKNASQQPPVLVWVDYGVTEQTVNEIEDILKKDQNIKSYTRKTPQENFLQFKKDLGEDSKVLDGFDPSLLPYTFTVQLLESSESLDFKTKMEGAFGVRKVEYSQPVTEFLNNARTAVNFITLTAFIVLCGITLFIISNMVRIAVFSRSEEIGIMKYVGATNRYIRVPYIIEGSIVGFLGAVLANAAVLFLYSLIIGRSAGGMGNITFLALVPVSQITTAVVITNLLLGVLVGAVGSAISVRRHVKV